MGGFGRYHIMKFCLKLSLLSKLPNQNFLIFILAILFINCEDTVLQQSNFDIDNDKLMNAELKLRKKITWFLNYQP